MIGFGKAWNREEQFDDILLDPNQRIENRGPITHSQAGLGQRRASSTGERRDRETVEERERAERKWKARKRWALGF